MSAGWNTLAYYVISIDEKLDKICPEKDRQRERERERLKMFSFSIELVISD